MDEAPHPLMITQMDLQKIYNQIHLQTKFYPQKAAAVKLFCTKEKLLTPSLLHSCSCVRGKCSTAEKYFTPKKQNVGVKPETHSTATGKNDSTHELFLLARGDRPPTAFLLQRFCVSPAPFICIHRGHTHVSICVSYAGKSVTWIISSYRAG